MLEDLPAITSIKFELSTADQPEGNADIRHMHASQVIDSVNSWKEQVEGKFENEKDRRIALRHMDMALQDTEDKIRADSEAERAAQSYYALPLTELKGAHLIHITESTQRKMAIIETMRNRSQESAVYDHTRKALSATLSKIVRDAKNKEMIYLDQGPLIGEWDYEASVMDRVNLHYRMPKRK